MPNHVTNVLTLHGESDQIRAMLEAIQYDDLGIGSVDFNKIIPMPESLNIEAGSQTSTGLKAYQDFIEVYTLGGTIHQDDLENIPRKSEDAFLRQRSDIRPKEWKLGKAAWNNIRLYGVLTWYGWRNQHWGTKWNSYGEAEVNYQEGNTATFARVQEELARRASKRKVKQTGTTTEQGKYCGKYALTELLICGECGTPYRRCTWTVGGKKRIVWRCINRLDYGKKYCHHSPTMEEAPLQNAIMDAVLKTAQIDPNILQTLKQHIRLGLGAGAGEDKSVEIQIRIAQIDQEFKSLLNSVTAENQQELLTDPRITDLMTEKRQLEKELAEYAAAEQHRQNTASRLDNIFTILDGMKNHPLTYDDAVIRQILQCVIVESKEKIKVVFIGGMEVETEVEQ